MAEVTRKRREDAQDAAVVALATVGFRSPRDRDRALAGVEVALLAAEQRGAERERAAVVAWLLKRGQLAAAAAIESGRHLEPSDPKGPTK